MPKLCEQWMLKGAQAGVDECYNAAMLFVILALLQTEGVNPLTAVRLILALVCVIAASSLALGVAVGLSRRMQAIADQRPASAADQRQPDAAADEQSNDGLSR